MLSQDTAWEALAFTFSSEDDSHPGIGKVCYDFKRKNQTIKFCLNISLVGVLYIIPAHVVTESPVFLLAVEEMSDLPAEAGAIPLVEEPQVSTGVSAPGTDFALPVALEEITHTPCAPLLGLGVALHDHNLPGQVPEYS